MVLQSSWELEWEAERVCAKFQPLAGGGCGALRVDSEGVRLDFFPESETK